MKIIFYVALYAFALLEWTSCKRPKRPRKTKPPPNPYQKWEAYVNQLAQHTTPWVERYSPNFGYEPYWATGDWILEKFRVNGTTTSSTHPPQVCGQDCARMYRDVGPVCAMRPYTTKYASSGSRYSCWSGMYTASCTGRWVDGHPYITYRTYCEYLAEECQNDQRYAVLGNTEGNNVIFVHRGACMPMVTSDKVDKIGIFQYMDSRDHYYGRDNPAVTRMQAFLTQLFNRQKAYNKSITIPFYAWEVPTTTRYIPPAVTQKQG